jgi:cytoplasmic FMR1 interacting protein
MFDVLEPEIKKLKSFMYFQKETIAVFCDHVKRLGAILDPTKKKKEEVTPPSDSYILCIIQLLDKLALLDELKNMKACLNNDFSFYKR